MPDQTPDEAVAEMMVEGMASNAMTASEFAKHPLGEMDLTACLNALVDSAERVNAGDLGAAEAMLNAQAVSLNSIFTHLALRAQINLTAHLDAAERFMRLAMKAQSQCRATIETLSVIKNPSAVFARQANITSGPQVNIGVPLARAGTLESVRNELLEANVERLDTRTTSTTIAGHSRLASVATIDRAKDNGG